jgi:hypothetical protein
MIRLEDTNGKQWTLYERIDANKKNQIYPNWTSLILGDDEIQAPYRRCSLPHHVADQWIAGRVRVRINA